MNSTTEESSDELSEKKVYRCTYKDCNATFSKNSKLTYHIRRHTGERPFACDEPNCNKAYLYSFHLRRHKETHLNKTKHQHIPCTVEGCYLELANKYSLKKHIKRVHNLDRSYLFQCETCKQGFNRKKQLIHHVYIHTGVPSFECPMCNLKFGTIRDVTRHKRTHTKYSCKCGQNFERWTEFLTHKKECQSAWHTCGVCEKKFKQRSNLNSHMSTHLPPENKFTCGYDDCGRSYLHKRNLLQHIQRYHQKKVKRIVCPLFGADCKQTFTKNQNLKYHMRRFHSNEPIVKKPRKPRKDKGLPRERSMAAILAGLPLTDKDHKNVVRGIPIELPQLQIENAPATKSILDQSKLILRNCGSESDVCEESEPDFVKIIC